MDYMDLINDRKEVIAMANYHFEATVISRGKGRSITGSVNYISGVRLRDYYSNRTYYRRRDDVVFCKVFQ